MQLNDDQKQIVASWVKEGASLSQVQKRIHAEFGVPMTYMDVRFLVIDLDVQLQDQEEPKAEPEAAVPDVTEPAEEDPLAPDTADGAVHVEVDKLMRPGALVSGTVVFSDGVQATWLVDQAGRFGIEPSQPGYQPSPEDLTELQTQLQNALGRMGY